MALKAKDITEYIEKFLLPVIKSWVKDRVEEEFQAYRYAIRIKEEWCCNAMKTFAKERYGLPTPRVPKDHIGWCSINLQLCGHHIMYCPFCGCKL